MKTNFPARWQLRPAPVPAGPVWTALWGVSTAAAVCYLSLEWLFFATKPSFMSTLGIWERLRILLVAPLPLAVAAAGMSAILGGLERLAPGARGFLARAGGLWPGWIWACSFLLLLDNFTYTLFRVGVQTAAGGGRLGYLALFGLFWIGGWRLGMGMLRGVLAWRNPVRTVGGAALALGVLWSLLLATGREAAPPPDGAGAGGGRPNILLLAADGASASHLSLYGYERETTPALRAFFEDRGLICENAFANAVNSGGSIASMLTGKSPTTLKMYYPPEILTGRNAYEHLPGILRRLGYENVDIGARQFADAYDLNLRRAFHEANGRAESASRWQALAAAGLGAGAGYFLGSTWERLRDRLLHVAGAKDFASAYEVVAGEARAGAEQGDGPRIARLLRLIAEPRVRPFFAHVHLLGTHGPKFAPENPVFSKGKTQTEPYETDFYDDALREFDAAFARIAQALAAAGELDRTVVVLSSDHGAGWSRHRIPLAFRFPGGAHAGRIGTNAQNLDIAPTLLDYLGIPAPEWMTGTSLLAGAPPERRPIFIAAVNSRLVTTRKWLLDESRLKPPFYSLGTLAVAIGARMSTLDLETGRLAGEPVAGHTRPWAAGAEPPEAEVREILWRHLEESGYELPAAWTLESRTPPGR